MAKKNQPKKVSKVAGKKADAKEKSNRRPLKVAMKPLRLAGLVIWPRFMRNSWGELKLVTWPSWKLSRSLTIAVLIFAVIFAVFIGLVDWGLSKAFKELFLK